MVLKLFLLVLPPLVPRTLATPSSLSPIHPRLCIRATLIQFNTSSCLVPRLPLLYLDSLPHCNQNDLWKRQVSSSRLDAENLSMAYHCLQQKIHTLPTSQPRLEPGLTGRPLLLASSLTFWE